MIAHKKIDIKKVSELTGFTVGSIHHVWAGWRAKHGLTVSKKGGRPKGELQFIEQEIIEMTKTWVVASVILVCAFAFFFSSTTTVMAYSDDEIVEAIYRAEGGQKAKYPYGIRSIKCETEKSCRKIALNTVRNNRKRFARDNQGHEDFVSFLGSRYSPVGASNDPKGLNRHWMKNVRFHLKKGRTKP